MKRLFFIPVALWGLGACGGSFLFWNKPAQLDVGKICEEKGAAVGQTGSVRAGMELQNVRYDGESLSGRLLLTSAVGGLCLDKRLIESFALNVETVSECGTVRKPGFIVADVLAKPLREEDVMVVSPGYWYGKEISIPLFPSRDTEQAVPECIEVEFSFHALASGEAAHLRVRAIREPLPPGRQDSSGESPQP
ncbi:hypothetical protein POL68_17340 [Stigmatella sp. ncwal1]|uniref:Lipoprotein n=1 Tax=Stigmatella ashevillensis TaxID=2995309 RepID=A0ABT5D979_9BACT|nr:hypothetical protein [Stigmatella ashevillena]MDC0710245.1 hypothetical protein [Stigmatella ashevillena]